MRARWEGQELNRMARGKLAIYRISVRQDASEIVCYWFDYHGCCAVNVLMVVRKTLGY